MTRPDLDWKTLKSDIKITSQDVLIVTDVQNDFCPGGQLAVADGDSVIEPILRIAQRFEHIVLTQDWHTADHISFASAHPGKKPFEQIELSYGAQTLWPDHCVQGTPGAERNAVQHRDQLGGEHRLLAQVKVDLRKRSLAGERGVDNVERARIPPRGGGIAL